MKTALTILFRLLLYISLKLFQITNIRIMYLLYKKLQTKNTYFYSFLVIYFYLKHIFRVSIEYLQRINDFNL